MTQLWHFLGIVAAVCYLASAVFYLYNFISSKSDFLFVRKALLTFGVFAHLIFLVTAVFQTTTSQIIESSPPFFSFTLSIVACLLICIFVFFEKQNKLPALGIFVIPLALFLTITSSFLFHLEKNFEKVPHHNNLLWAHIICAIVAHALFIFAFVLSLALVCEESLLKSKKMLHLLNKFPSLVKLDNLNLQIISAGFVFMLLGVAFGFIYAFSSNYGFIFYDSRLVWSSITLIIYGTLLCAHRYIGLRGSRAAWLSIIGYCSVVASFIGVNFFSSSFHAH